LTYDLPNELDDFTVTIRLNGSTGLAPGAAATAPCSTTVTCGLQPVPVAGGLPFAFALPLPFPAGGAATAADAVSAAAATAQRSSLSFMGSRTSSRVMPVGLVVAGDDYASASVRLSGRKTFARTTRTREVQRERDLHGENPAITPR